MAAAASILVLIAAEMVGAKAGLGYLDHRLAAELPDPGHPCRHRRDRHPRADPQRRSRPARATPVTLARNRYRRPTMSRQLHLNAFLMGAGHHEAAWRHPPTAEHRVLDLEHFQNWPASPNAASSIRCSSPTARRRAAANTTSCRCSSPSPCSRRSLSPPSHRPDRDRVDHVQRAVHLARRFASLDHISGGRAGWNIVTSRPRRGSELRSRRRSRRTRTATRGQTSSSTSRWRCGTAGNPTRCSWMPRAAPSPTRPACTPSTTTAGVSGARPAEFAALAAGPAAAGAGGVVGIRQGLRRPLRRGGVHRAAHPRRGSGSSTAT